MPRRKAAPKREVLPDPLFKSMLLAKFTNVIMRSGKKSIAERIVYGALDIVHSKTRGRFAVQAEEGSAGEGGAESGDIRSSVRARAEAMEAFGKALENITPSVEVKSRRVGGSTYQVPVEIRASRRKALAMRWLAEYASKRNEKTMIMRLAGEILDAIEGRGGAVKKREDVHRMAKSNQAFAHYKW